MSLNWMCICVILLVFQLTSSFHLHIITTDPNNHEMTETFQIITLPVDEFQLLGSDELGKAYVPVDFFRDVQRIVFTIIQFVQQSSNANGQWPPSKSKKPKKPKYPINQVNIKQIFNRFGLGNVSFGFGFTFNVQVSAGS